MKNIFMKYIKIIIVVSVLLLLLLLYLVFSRKNDTSFDDIMIDKVDDIEYLYMLVSDIPCERGLYVNIPLNKKVKVSDIDRKVLLNYLFAFLDRNALLNDKTDKKIINFAENELFYKRKSSLFNNNDLHLFRNINNFQYGDYVYSVKDNMLIKNEKSCVNNEVYVTALLENGVSDNYGYIDVGIGKLVNDTIYDVVGNKLGDYDSESNMLGDILLNGPYYRYYYIKENGSYKLDSIELRDKRNTELNVEKQY